MNKKMTITITYNASQYSSDQFEENVKAEMDAHFNHYASGLYGVDFEMSVVEEKE